MPMRLGQRTRLQAGLNAPTTSMFIANAHHRLPAIQCRETGRRVLRRHFNAGESGYACNDQAPDVPKNAETGDDAQYGQSYSAPTTRDHCPAGNPK
jgi:hypothetical protein